MFYSLANPMSMFTYFLYVFYFKDIIPAEDEYDTNSILAYLKKNIMNTTNFKYI